MFGIGGDIGPNTFDELLKKASTSEVDTRGTIRANNQINSVVNVLFPSKSSIVNHNIIV